MAMPLFGAASLFLQGVSAQELCACSPSRYTFTLDFSLSCPPVNVTRNGGISATFCQVSPFGDEFHNITDLVPAEVMYVDVLELGQAFEVLSQQNITGSFMDGDQFDYTSIVEEEDNLEIPKVIQLNIFAQNAAGEAIVNFFAISYSNVCDEYPSLVEGESAGWTHFVSVVNGWKYDYAYCVCVFAWFLRPCVGWPFLNAPFLFVISLKTRHHWSHLLSKIVPPRLYLLRHPQQTSPPRLPLLWRLTPLPPQPLLLWRPMIQRPDRLRASQPQLQWPWLPNYQPRLRKTPTSRHLSCRWTCPWIWEGCWRTTMSCP